MMRPHCLAHVPTDVGVGRPTGSTRNGPWLSLDDAGQLMRRLITRLASEVWSCVLVGHPAPKVAARFQRRAAGDVCRWTNAEFIAVDLRMP